MIKNYLIISFRYLVRHKEYTVINILGLAVSITCCILIMLFVRSELSYDAFHSKADRLYRVWQRRKLEDKMADFVFTSMPLANGMQNSFPQAEAACRVHSLKPIVKIGQRSFAEKVDVVDPSFFKMFDFKIAEGSRDPFSLDNSIVITAAAAKKYFGSSDAIGKNIVINFGDEKLMQDTKSSGKDEVIFTVRGIIKEVPEASSIKYGALISFADAKNIFFPAMLRSWFGINTETYVLLKPGVTASAMEKKFPAMLKQYLGADFKGQDFSLYLQPIKDIHLDTSLPAGNEPISDRKYSYILGTIGLLILLVACINFVSLSIGQSAKRALEVGVRKAMGAARGQLIFQFWGEALMVVLLSVLIGLFFSSLLIGPFDILVNRQISIHFDWFFILFCTLMVVVIAIISGIYPALILSGFNPVEVLKGKLNIKGGMGWLRQGLVVGQFVTSIVMIIGTVVIGQQMHYLQTKDLGYKKDQVVIVETHKTLTNGFSIAALYRTELMKQPQVISASVSLFSFIQTPWAELGFNDDRKQFKLFQYNAVDANFVPAMGIKLIAGRNFEAGNPQDLGGSAIVNEAFIKEFNLTNPIGKKLSEGFPQHIIGVVKDFNFESLHTKIQPLVMSVSPDSLMFISAHMLLGATATLQPRISVQLRAGNLLENIRVMKQAWAVVAPGQDFDYKFLDEAVAAQYKQEQRTNMVVQIASALSIFIACMGLFGLATLSVVSRIKEIGIRKVLGASVSGIVKLLSVDFVMLVLIAAIIASPIALWAIKKWLQDFSYRVEINWWVFLLVGLAAMFIALATVSYHAIKAAMVNPVKSLKTE
jgi:putative ABC transport system permease protein